MRWYRSRARSSRLVQDRVRLRRRHRRQRLHPAHLGQRLHQAHASAAIGTGGAQFTATAAPAVNRVRGEEERATPEPGTIQAATPPGSRIWRIRPLDRLTGQLPPWATRAPGAAVLYGAVLAVCYAPVLFNGKSLQAPLYTSSAVVPAPPPGGADRRPVNTF